MNTRLVASLLVAGAFAFACGPRPHSEASTLVSAFNNAPTSARHAKPKDRAKPAKLDARFIARWDDGSLNMALQLTNAGDKKLELAFPSGQEYDFALVDSVGRAVWRWSEGRMFTQALQYKLLEGGESARFDARFTGRLAPGHYVAIATLRSSNYPLEQRADVVVP